MQTFGSKNPFRTALVGMALASSMLLAGCGSDKGDTGTQVPKAAEDPTAKAQDSMNAYRQQNNIPAPKPAAP